MNRAGLNFSPNGYHYGIVHMLPSFFRQADLSILGKMAHFIEFSFDTEVHGSFYHELALAFQLFEPLVVKMQLATPEEWRILSQKGLLFYGDTCGLFLRKEQRTSSKVVMLSYLSISQHFGS